MRVMRFTVIIVLLAAFSMAVAHPLHYETLHPRKAPAKKKVKPCQLTHCIAALFPPIASCLNAILKFGTDIGADINCAANIGDKLSLNVPSPCGGCYPRVIRKIIFRTSKRVLVKMRQGAIVVQKGVIYGGKKAIAVTSKAGEKIAWEASNAHMNIAASAPVQKVSSAAGQINEKLSSAGQTIKSTPIMNHVASAVSKAGKGVVGGVTSLTRLAGNYATSVGRNRCSTPAQRHSRVSGINGVTRLSRFELENDDLVPVLLDDVDEERTPSEHSGDDYVCR